MRIRVLLALLLAVALPRPARAQLLFERLARADSLARAGRHADAVGAFAQVVEIGDGDPTILAALARYALRAGLRDSAARSLQAALAGGWVPPRHVDSLPDFRPLHDHAAWPRVRDTFRRRAAARDTALRAELLALARRDQQHRAELPRVLQQYGPGSPQADSAWRRLAAADAPIAARVRAIIDSGGWPTITRVGADGAHAAWLVVQHMDDSLQARLLPGLLAAVRAGEARPADAAMLEDRVLASAGRPQRHGTQVKDGQVLPIDRPACVDVRRARVRMQPMVDYARMLGAEWTAPAGRCEESGSAN